MIRPHLVWVCGYNDHWLRVFVAARAAQLLAPHALGRRGPTSRYCTEAIREHIEEMMQELHSAISELLNQAPWLADNLVLDAEHTGLAASWCALCGDCTCPRTEDGDAVYALTRNPCGSYRAERKVDPRCPLHAPTSTHLAVALSILRGE